MPGNRSKNQTAEEAARERVAQHEAKSRLWAPRRLEFTREEVEALTSCAYLDPESRAGEVFVDAVAILCGSLEGRAHAVDSGLPKKATVRAELDGLHEALAAARASLGTLSSRLLGMSAAVAERLAGGLVDSGPGGANALWKLRARLNTEVGPAMLNNSALHEFLECVEAARNDLDDLVDGRPRKRALADTVRELAAVFQLAHQRPADALEGAFRYFFALLLPVLEGSASELAREPSAEAEEAAYQWCRSHRVSQLRRSETRDEDRLEALIRTVSPALGGDPRVSATDYDQKRISQLNDMLRSARPDPPADE